MSRKRIESVDKAASESGVPSPFKASAADTASPSRAGQASLLLDVGSGGLPVGHSVRILKKNPKADEVVRSAKLGALPAKSMLMERLDAFLPQMHRANVELQERIAVEGIEAVNIEAVGEDDPHILMDVAIAPLEDDDEGPADSLSDSADSDDSMSRSKTLIKEMD